MILGHFFILILNNAFLLLAPLPDTILIRPEPNKKYRLLASPNIETAHQSGVEKVGQKISAYNKDKICRLF